VPRPDKELSVVDHTAAGARPEDWQSFLDLDHLRRDWLRRYGEILGFPPVSVHWPGGERALIGTPFEKNGFEIDVQGGPAAWDKFIDTSDQWLRWFLETHLNSNFPECLDEYSRLQLQAIPNEDLPGLTLENLHELAFQLAKVITVAVTDGRMATVDVVHRFELVLDAMVYAQPIVDHPPHHAEWSRQRLRDETAMGVVLARDVPAPDTDPQFRSQTVQPVRIQRLNRTVEAQRRYQIKHRDLLPDEWTRRRVADVRLSILDEAAVRKWPEVELEKTEPSTGRCVLSGERIAANRLAWEQHVFGETSFARLEELRSVVRQIPPTATIQAPDAVDTDTACEGERPQAPSGWDHQIRDLSHDESYAQCLRVRERHRSGESLRLIADSLGRARSTIKSWIEWADDADALQAERG
jgi:hypothetical protein